MQTMKLVLRQIIMRNLLVSSLLIIFGANVIWPHDGHDARPANPVLPAARDQLHLSVRPFTVAPQLKFTPRESAILGQVIADLTANALSRTNIVHVLDDDTIKAELDAHKSDWGQLLDNKTMANSAISIDVDLIVQGIITSLGIDTENKTVVTELHFTVYEAKFGTVLCTGTAVGQDADDILAVGDSFDPTGVLWSRSRLGHAARMASEQIAGLLLAAIPIHGQVLTILPNGATMLDVGYTIGIKLGDTFSCDRISEEVDGNNNNVKKSIRKIGTLLVIGLLPNACICAPVDAGADVPQSDDVVTLLRK